MRHFMKKRSVFLDQLTKPQLEGVADIFADAGQVFLALVAGAFFAGVDNFRLDLLLSGLLLMLICWVVAIKIRRHI